MTKHHHLSKEEQIYNKAHGAQPFHFEKKPYRANEASADDHEKDGPALRNSSESKSHFKK